MKFALTEEVRVVLPESTAARLSNLLKTRAVCQSGEPKATKNLVSPSERLYPFVATTRSVRRSQRLRSNALTGK